MEAFSLLKYWRTTAATGETTDADSRAATKTIVAAPAAVSPYSSDGEDGPYFDLEFTLPDQDSDADDDISAESEQKVVKSENGEETENGSDVEEISLHDDDDDEEGELKFALAGDDCTDQNAAVSPSDELFFKGDLVSIEPSSILLNGSEENSKIPVFLLKSATKFRVLLLKLKKSKQGNGEKAEKQPEKENQGKVSGKLFAVKFKVEEVPIVSLFTRDSSSKESHGGKVQKQSIEDSETNAPPLMEDKKLTKEVVHKYLKMVKPFYIRVSKRYVEKLKFSVPGGGSKGCAAAPPEKGVETSAAEPASSNVKAQTKQGNNLQAGLKVVRKRLGKSRSASAAVAPPPQISSNRRDDSLLQVQDGIQGAILHCKKSFNAYRDGESSSSSSLSSSSVLCRSVSDPSYEKSVKIPKDSSSSSTTDAEGGN